MRFAGTADILAAMDALFGFDGTQEFLKDNLFEVKNYKTYPLQVTTIYFSDAWWVCVLDTALVFTLNFLL